MRRAVCLIALCSCVLLAGCTLLTSLSSNKPPEAIIDARPLQGRAPLPVRLDGSGSTDDGEIAAYQWTFDSGSDAVTAAGVQVDHTFETSGTHVVQLAVSDDAGLVGTAEVVIQVENTAPLASCRFSSDSPVVGEWILFDASASFDPDGRIVDFVWEFGDGESMRGTRVGHAYEEIGIYEVRLTIEDNAGATVTIVHSFTVHLGGGASGGCGGRSLTPGLS